MYNKLELSEQVKKIKGERTIRQFAADTSVNQSILSRIITGDYKPGVKMLEKIIDPKTKPRGSVSREDIMIAAGYIEPANNKKELMLASLPAGMAIASLGLAFLTPAAAIPAYKLSELLMKKAYENIKEDKDLTSINLESKDDIDFEKELKMHEDANNKYINLCMSKIMLSVIETGSIAIGKLDPKELNTPVYPDRILSVNNHNIETWWFKFYNHSEAKDFSSIYTPKEICLALFGSVVAVPADEKRKLSFVVNDKKIFEEFKTLKYLNSYRGNISVIFIDPENELTIKEEIISKYDDAISEDELIKLS